MPSTSTDRLQGLTTSLAVKPPCRTVSTANITLSGLQTVNTVALAEGDRVLVIGQTNATKNGIYNASTSDWQRAKDFDGNRDVVQGTIVMVNLVNSNALFYRVTTADPIVIDSSSIGFQAVADPSHPYSQFSVKGFGAAGDGVTDDWVAIQNADTVARVAGVPLVFQGGVYMVDCTAHGGSLSQTTSWVAEPGTQVVIRRKDFTATTAYFIGQMTSQTGLTLRGIKFDGQVTTMASSVANQDLGAVGSYNDTTDESLWRKPYGFRILNSSNFRVEDCDFDNFLRAGLHLVSSGIGTAMCQNGVVTGVNVNRTRSGSGGDGIYFGGASNIKVTNTHISDYQRIAYVMELAQDGTTNCRDITIDDTCTADYGHDAVAPESNVAFWVESGENIKCYGRSTRTGFGGVFNVSSQSDQNAGTRPLVASADFSRMRSFSCQGILFANMGGTRSVVLNADGMVGEADQTITYAKTSLGLRAGIMISWVEVTPGVNCRINLRDLSVTALNQSNGTLTNGFGCVRISAGVATTPQQLKIDLHGLQTQWSKSDGTDDVGAKTDYQNVTNGYFGDVVFSGALDAPSDHRFRGHASLSGLHNHTFGYAMISSEVFSSESNIKISDSRISLRRGSQANNGRLIISDCPLVDIRGDLGWNTMKIANSTLNDADSSAKDRTSLSCPLIMIDNCHVLRQLLQALSGGDTTHRKLRMVGHGNTFDIAFHVEPALKFALVDGTFAHANLTGNVFRNLGTGSIASTDSMILVVTATGTLQLSGAGNTFDKAVTDGGGHVIQYNSTPTYNDAPQTVATPFLSVFGVLATFDPV